MSHRDTIVIGAGSGGLTVAVGLSRMGRRVLLVERNRVGGDCTNLGCIPSKTLLALTGASCRSAGGSPLNAPKILAEVRRRRDQLERAEVEEYSSTDGIELMFGPARLTGDGTVAVGEGVPRPEQFTAEHIVIATGSSPRRIPIPGLPAERYLTNEELFELETAPDHLAIVGGGAIGLEMAQAFSRLGSRVTLVEAADRVLPSALPEASAALSTILTTAGVDLRIGATVDRYDPATKDLLLAPNPAVSDRRVQCVDAVLVAVGRVPNTDGLGLEAAGVDRTRSGHILINARGRTTAERIWAVGDATIRGGATHTAEAWGRRVFQSIAAPRVPLAPIPQSVSVVFTSPEMASIGRHLPTPPGPNDDIVRLTIDLADLDRAYTDEPYTDQRYTDQPDPGRGTVGSTEPGLIIVDVQRLRGTIVAATVVAPRAGEMITTFSLAMRNRIPLHRFYGMIHPYPTYSEAISRVVDDYIALTGGNLGAEVTGWARRRLRIDRLRIDRTR